VKDELCYIVDFGSQYTQLITRKLRELKVLSEIISPEDFLQKDLSDSKAVIFSGGPQSVVDLDIDAFEKATKAYDKPILGICYGMQLMAKIYGGKVESAKSREYGVDQIQIEGSQLLPELQRTSVLLSHGDHVDKAPKNFRISAHSLNQVIAMIESPELQRYGVQFHPEVTHTKNGSLLLRSFLEKAGFQFNWEEKHIFKEISERLQANFSDGKILCALSGGVDSTVLAVALNKIFPGQVHCFCVDTGLMRKDEISNLRSLFEKHFHFPIEIIDAEKRFLDRLAGVTDPEQKRKIIGKEFIEIFEMESKAHSDFKYLAQGTLYPDVIESMSAHGGPTAKIKSHHNVGGLPEKLPFQLLEPFRLLFKDEVRRLGEFLGLPHEFVWRHPFPGPGLAIRCIGEVRKERLDRLREADAILQEVLKAENFYESLWQSFCVYLPVHSVGVMGDGRTYEECIAVRCVHSDDGMTAHIAALPVQILERISARIINEVSGINRVVYDISSKPPATIEWE